MSRLSPLTYYINGYYNIMDQYLTSFNLDAVFFSFFFERLCLFWDDKDDRDGVSAGPGLGNTEGVAVLRDTK